MAELPFGIERLSYKELQTVAKQCHIPANMQRKFLIQALMAYQSNNLGLVDTIVSNYRTSRKRKMVNRPQNLTTSKKKKRNQQKLLSRNRDEIIVDSTSSDVNKEPTSLDFLNTFNTSGGLSDSHSPSIVERYPFFTRFHHGQQFSDIAQLNSNNFSESRFSSLFGYEHQMNFRNPSNASAPYNSTTTSKFPLYQDTPQNYQPVDVATSSYYSNTGMYRPSPYPHYSNITMYDSSNPRTNNHHVSQNYHSQLSVDSEYESNSVVVANNAQDEQFRICAVSKNSFCSRSGSNSQSPSIEVDSGSYILPSNTQLNSSAVNDLRGTFESCVTWPQTSVVLHNSDRKNEVKIVSQSNDSFSNFSDPKDENVSSVEHVSARMENDIQSVTQNFSFRVATHPKNENIGVINSTVVSPESSFHHSNHSDEEPLSLSEDIASLLELERQTYDIQKSYSKLSFPSESLSEPTPTNSNNYPVEGNSSSKLADGNDNQFQVNESSSSGGTTADNSREQSAQGSENCSFLDISSSSQQYSQMPALVSLFGLGQMPGGETCMNQQNFSRVYQNSSTYVDGDCATFNNPEKNQETENIIDLYSPEKVEYNSLDNILHHRSSQHDPCSASGIVSVYSENQRVCKVSGKEDSGGNVRTMNIPNGQEVKVWLPDKISQLKLKQQAIREDQNNLSGKVIMNARWRAEKFHNSNEVVVKSEVGRLFYESETLHRSKIICEIPNKDGIKNENIRKLVKMLSPAETYLGLKPLTMIKNLAEQEQDMSEPSLTVIPSCRPCINRRKGCSIVLRVEYAHIHEKKCVFQSVSCPSESCTWYDSMNLLIQHIKEFHVGEIKNRSQYVYIVDRIDDNRPSHAFFQIHNDIIYVIRLHITSEKCIAVARYIPEIESMICKTKQLRGIMQLMCFSDKLKMKTWRGCIQPYYENEKSHHELGDQSCYENDSQQEKIEEGIQLSVGDSEFVIIRFFIN